MNKYTKLTQEQLLSAVWDYSADAMRITDLKGKVISVNNAYCNLTGFEKESLIGKSFKIIWEKKEQEEILKFYKEFISSGKINKRADRELTSKSGKKCYLDELYSLIEMSGEKYVLCIFRDITNRKQGEEKLITSETRYRRLFEAARDGIIILDAETGMIVDVNPFLIELLGYSHKAFLGKAIWNIGLFKDIAANKDNFLELVKKEYIRYEDLPLETSNGQKINVEFVSYLYYVDNKKVIQCNIRDITERKRGEEELKESVEKYKTLIETMPLGFYRTTGEGYFVDVNPALVNMLGYDSKEELMKVYIPEALYFLKSERVVNINFNNIGFLTDAEIYRIKKKDGSEMWVEDHARYIKDSSGNVLYHEGIMHDVTESLRARNAILEAKEKAEEANRLKSGFLANMSHEIRTPLNGILGFTEILRDELSNIEHITYTDIIQRSGKRLLETLDLILTFSKLESEKQDINFSNVKIEYLIAETIQIFDIMAKTKNLYLKSIIKEENISTKSDERFIRHILNNLVNNAIKFTESGGVTIELSKDNKNICIKVKDTGIGIAKSKQEIIFEEFRQESEGFSRSFEGTGLGLAITKRFVEMMKGKISVESEKGKCSSFIIELPFEDFSKSINIKLDKNESVIEKNETQEENILKTSILIVEDDEDNKSYIKTILSKYSIDSITDGPTAIHFAKEKLYDIILLDINLGKGMDGIEVVKEIRKLDNYKKTPIVALTAYVLYGDKEEFLAAGCSHYLGKPFKKEQLLELVNNIIDKD